VTLQDQDFANVDLSDGSTTTDRYFSGTASLGRFVPDHFVISSAAITQACSAFTYFGQDGFTAGFTLTPVNASGNATINYPATAPGMSLNSRTSMGLTTTTLPAGSSLAASTTTPTPTVTWDNTTGSATVTLLKSQVSRPTVLTAPTTLTIMVAPVDSDGITVASAYTLGTTLLRYGRLRLSNTFGSVSPLKMPIEAQYWSGNSWVRNTDDSAASCTPVASIPFTFDSSGWTPLTLPANLSSGAEFISIAPTSNETKTLTAILTAYPWLKSRWGGTAYDQNPSAKATFGIYAPETSKTIHVR